MGVSRASLTIGLCFMAAVVVFVVWAVFMVRRDRRIRAFPIDDLVPVRPRAARVPVTALPDYEVALRPAQVGRLRIAVISATFLLWSLAVSEHYVHLRR
jgi:hypothetical protein